MFSWIGLFVLRILALLWIPALSFINMYQILCMHTGHVIVNLILKAFVSRDPKLLIKAFVTYVRPLLEYCAPVWSPYRVGLIKKVKAVQRRFTKRIVGIHKHCYSTRLKFLCLDALQIRRIKLDLVLCYNIIRGFVCINCTSFFKNY
jgi:hypothetical protein